MGPVEFIREDLDFFSALGAVAGKSTQFAKIFKSRTMGRRRRVLWHFFFLLIIHLRLKILKILTLLKVLDFKISLYQS